MKWTTSTLLTYKIKITGQRKTNYSDVQVNLVLLLFTL